MTSLSHTLACLGDLACGRFPRDAKGRNKSLPLVTNGTTARATGGSILTHFNCWPGNKPIAPSELALTMSDNSSSWPLPDYSQAWKELSDHGWALIHDWALGISEGSRNQFHQRYFNDHMLRRDEGDWPRDRKRARDVIYYEWSGSELSLSEHETVTITDRGGIKGERIHKRVEILPDNQAEELVRVLLCLVPPMRRQREGTLGVNFFRTYTDVVTRPHHDDEEYILLYMMHRDGGGAESYLYRDYEPFLGGPPDEPVLDHYQLNPGELLIFEDRLFTHGATPLDPSREGHAMRDLMVLTVDYAETYLKRNSHTRRPHAATER